MTNRATMRGRLPPSPLAGEGRGEGALFQDVLTPSFPMFLTLSCPTFQTPSFPMFLTLSFPTLLIGNPCPRGAG